MGPGRNTSQHAPQCLKLSPEKPKNKKLQKKMAGLHFHRHHHFGTDLCCCCGGCYFGKTVCFKPRLHPRVAAGATLMPVRINCGVGLHQLDLHMRLRCRRIVNSHLSLNLFLPFVSLQGMWLYTHLHSFARGTSWMHYEKRVLWNSTSSHRLFLCSFTVK